MSVNNVEPVRAEWRFALAEATQRFAGRAMQPEPDEFLRAVEQLIEDLPAPGSPAERFSLRDRLFVDTVKCARQFHAQFHRCFPGPCASGTPGWTTLVWEDVSLDPRIPLANWASAFIDEFSATHPWPAAVRAARLIRQACEKPLNVERLAHETGCARSALMRQFQRIFGMPMGRYQAHWRIQRAFTPLRQPGSNVGEIAHAVGYRSRKNFNRVLRELTGLTPSHVRALGEPDARDVVERLSRQRSLNIADAVGAV
jgi:AraC-like DNA-binding protein